MRTSLVKGNDGAGAPIMRTPDDEKEARLALLITEAHEEAEYRNYNRETTRACMAGWRKRHGYTPDEVKTAVDRICTEHDAELAKREEELELELELAQTASSPDVTQSNKANKKLIKPQHPRAERSGKREQPFLLRWRRAVC